LAYTDSSSVGTRNLTFTDVRSHRPHGLSYQ
jgi:hypothetical protein